MGLQLVEGNLNRPKMKYPRPEKMSRSLSASNDILNMSKNELGDYYIYSLNDKHNLGANESIILIRMYGPLEVGYNKKYVFENTDRSKKKSLLRFSLLWKILSLMV